MLEGLVPEYQASNEPNDTFFRLKVVELSRTVTTTGYVVTSAIQVFLLTRDLAGRIAKDWDIALKTSGVLGLIGKAGWRGHTVTAIVRISVVIIVVLLMAVTTSLLLLLLLLLGRTRVRVHR